MSHSALDPKKTFSLEALRKEEAVKLLFYFKRIYFEWFDFIVIQVRIELSQELVTQFV